MQKNNTGIYQGLLAVLLGCAIFIMCAVRVSAAEITGELVYFTHTHTGACDKTVTEYCSGHHSMSKVETHAQLDCDTCRRVTDIVLRGTNGYCSETGVHWTQSGVATCTVCGVVSFEWGQEMPYHDYKVTSRVCGLQSGENIVSIQAYGDGDWTNSGVLLSARTNKLKQDSINSNITYNWTDGQLFVTENGTYTLTATNGAGESISSTVIVSCIDKTPPVIDSVSGDTNTMTRDAITVSISASDGESGLAEDAYSTDGGASWSSNTSLYVTEGKVVQLMVRDKVGNVTGKVIRRGDFAYPPAPSVPSVPTTSATGTVGGGETEAVTGNAETGNAGAATNTQVSTSTEKPATQNSNASATAERKADVKSTEDQVTDKNGEKETREKDSSEVGESEEETIEESAEESTVPVFRVEESPLVAYGTPVTDEKDIKTGLQGTAQSTRETAEQFEAQSQGLSAQGGLASVGVVSGTESLLSRVLTITGVILIIAALLLALRAVWLGSVILYCYDGSDEYQRLAILRLKKSKKGFELFLPEDLLDSSETPRYRLLVKSQLVKRYEHADLTLQSKTRKLRQPLEECVDFVL